MRVALVSFLLLSIAVGGRAQQPKIKLPPLSSFIQPLPSASLTQLPAAAAPLTLTLQDALARARASSQAYLSAAAAASIAREDRIQARAGLLPSVSFGNEYIYTQGNGTETGIFVSADGVHVYTSQAIVHDETFSLTRRLEYRRTLAAEAVARARQDIALRGLSTAVLQNYFTLAGAQRKLSNAQQSLDDARSFLQITQNLENGGEVAHADVIKAQILVEQRQRDVSEAQLAIEKARIALAVLVFPDFNEDFTVVDDLLTISALAPLSDLQLKATQTSPDIRAAQSTLRQESTGLSIARSEFLPTLTLDYFYGINSNQFATQSDGLNRLGSGAQATLNIPVFNFNATRSRVRQAQLRQEQARLELALANKELAADVNTLYREAQVARSALDSLRTTLDLSTESLRLTLLRYQAGEVGVLEVVDAQTTLAEARNAYDDGLVRYRTVWAILEVLSGNL
jgi:outer membrane protein